MKNILQLVQQVTLELGLPYPTAALSNTDTNIQQIIALIRAAIRDDLMKFEWQALQTEYRFYAVSVTQSGLTTINQNTMTVSDATGIQAGYLVSGNGIPSDCHVLNVVGTTITLDANASSTSSGSYIFGEDKYALPADFDHIIDRTEWDKTNRWEQLGPKSPQEWQWMKSGVISTGPRSRWRIYGGYYQIWPVPVNGIRFGYEYVSNYWARSNTGSSQADFLADTDVCIFPDSLIITAAKYKFFAIKGFDTTDFKRDYYLAIETALGKDAGNATLSLSPRTSSILLTSNNIPDTGYGQ